MTPLIKYAAAVLMFVNVLLCSTSTDPTAPTDRPGTVHPILMSVSARRFPSFKDHWCVGAKSAVFHAVESDWQCAMHEAVSITEVSLDLGNVVWVLDPNFAGCWELVEINALTRDSLLKFVGGLRDALTLTPSNPGEYLKVRAVFCSSKIAKYVIRVCGMPNELDLG